MALSNVACERTHCFALSSDYGTDVNDAPLANRRFFAIERSPHGELVIATVHRGRFTVTNGQGDDFTLSLPFVTHYDRTAPPLVEIVGFTTDGRRFPYLAVSVRAASPQPLPKPFNVYETFLFRREDRIEEGPVEGPTQLYTGELAYVIGEDHPANKRLLQSFLVMGCESQRVRANIKTHMRLASRKFALLSGGTLIELTLQQLKARGIARGVLHYTRLRANIPHRRRDCVDMRQEGDELLLLYRPFYPTCAPLQFTSVSGRDATHQLNEGEQYRRMRPLHGITGDNYSGAFIRLKNGDIAAKVIPPDSKHEDGLVTWMREGGKPRSAFDAVSTIFYERGIPHFYGVTRKGAVILQELL